MYEQGDIPDFMPQARELTIAAVLKPIYEIRNCIAHGDKIPDVFFTETMRQGLNGPLSVVAVVDEALSIIVRRAVCKILAERLTDHFRDSDSADEYFSSRLR